jgi:Lrp/AsnC family transcriptional regulator for asnA, asnC and gidA
VSVESQFDSIDFRILQALANDARIAYSRLAEQLNVSNSLVHQRVRKLQDAGMLTDPVYQLDAERLGYDTSAYCQIMLTNARYLRSVVEALSKIPEVVECVNIAGRYAIMVKLFAINNSHLRDIIYEGIQTITGVEETNTVVSFETSFSRGVPIPGFHINEKQ